MKKTGSRFLPKFMKSRVMPVFSILMLFVVWLAIVGSIFWNIRIKETFRLTGRLNNIYEKNNQSDQANDGNTVTFLGDIEEDFVNADRIENIRLYADSDDGKSSKHLFDGNLIRVEKKDPHFRLTFQALKWKHELKNTIEQFELVLRQKRLLMVAFEEKEFKL